MVVPVKILTLFATKLKCLGVKRKKLISTLDVLDSVSCKVNWTLLGSCAMHKISFCKFQLMTDFYKISKYKTIVRIN